MKNVVRMMLVAGTLASVGACNYPKKYECTIRDANTGKVIEKVKVNSRAECDAIALGAGR